MLKTFALGPQHLLGLEKGDRVLITAENPVFLHTPALAVGIQQGELVFVYIDPKGIGKQGRLPLDQYGESWHLEIEDGFQVNTPDGILHAYSKRDLEYPGIAVDLYRPEDEDVGIGLSMTEYIPEGEGLCGYDASNPGLSRQEIDEIPVQRIRTEDHQQIASKDGITPANAGQYHISAGLVTRAWEDELNDVDSHRRVFHYGYDL